MVFAVEKLVAGYNRGFMAKIVLAISDRWVADVRVDAIADFAHRLEKSILVLHVAYGTEGSAAETSPGEKVLATVGGALTARGAKVETLFLFADDVGAAIVKTAEEQRASMILVGLSSKGMLTRLIEGNVAQEIIRSTRVPVLLLPAEWNGEI